jgi:hypothetical protein
MLHSTFSAAKRILVQGRNFGDFTPAKRFPTPFFECGGQGCRIISANMENKDDERNTQPVGRESEAHPAFGIIS